MDLLIIVLVVLSASVVGFFIGRARGFLDALEMMKDEENGRRK